MESSRVLIEIYEGDPFEGACCGPPVPAAPSDAKAQRDLLIQRSAAVKAAEKASGGQFVVRREIVSARRHDYPRAVQDLRRLGTPLPYVLVNGQVADTGAFPSTSRLLVLARAAIDGKQGA